MPWNNVAENEPPKDRIIEATWGGAWTYTDFYYAKTSKRRPNTTARTWSFTGGVVLAIWRSAEDLEREEGAWVDTQNMPIFPMFKFWREYENPLQEPGYLTQVVPPHAHYQDFSGDARLRLYDAMEAEIQKQIDLNTRFVSEDIAAGKTPLPSTVRALGLSEERLKVLKEMRADAYDPYELPEKVHGRNLER